MWWGEGDALTLVCRTHKCCCNPCSTITCVDGRPPRVVKSMLFAALLMGLIWRLYALPPLHRTLYRPKPQYAEWMTGAAEGKVAPEEPTEAELALLKKAGRGGGLRVGKGVPAGEVCQRGGHADRSDACAAVEARESRGRVGPEVYDSG